MPKIDIRPTELRDRHVKVYIEESVYKELLKYQGTFAHAATISECVRELIINGLERDLERNQS